MPYQTVGRALRARLCVTVLLALASALPGLAASPRITLWGHVPTAAIAASRALGRFDSQQPMSLSLTLPSRDPQGLADLIRRLYDPNDPLYGKYLTSAQFTERFGPTEADYQAVKDFAKNAGLAVTSTFSNRLILDVQGTAWQIEKAFGTHIYQFVKPDGTLFHAPDSDPTVPGEVAGIVSGVAGLDNLAVYKPHIRTDVPQGLIPHSGPAGGLTPSEIKTAYNLNGPLPTGPMPTGSGQTLAVFELDGYLPSDITQYEAQYGLPNVPLVNVLVDGVSGASSGTNGAAEVTLDIELQIAIAPNASKVVVYEGPNTDQGVIDTYNKIATDNVNSPINISSSWGLAELQNSASVRNSENIIFQAMAVAGQSIYAAAGDSGANDDGSTLSVDDPASQPFMVGVGGTRLITNPDHTYNSETTWNHGSAAAGAGGGGISVIWNKPGYQAGVGSSSTMRNVPDVSLDSDPSTGYSVRFKNSWTVYGGTSCAAPLWAAFTALVNQQRQTNGLTFLGFANPALYAIGNNPVQYAADFHDIADNSTNLFYHAVTGYDDATGWGTFNGANLLVDLAPSSAPDFSLSASPNGLSVVQGTSGSSTITVNPINGFSGGVTLSASGLPSAASVGFATNPTTGTCGVTLSTDNTTPIGTYTVTISGTSGSLTHSTTINLTVTSNGLDAPPTVATAAHATPNPVASTSAALSVLGADDGGEAPLTYTWAVTAKPASVAAPTFSVNGTNAAKNTTATFKGTGSYTFTVTIREPSGLTATSSVNMMVNQSISFITLTPASANIGPGTTQQFVATAKDLFGVTMTTQPTFTWTATGGTVNTSALYTAGPTNGSFQVTVTGGGKTAHATVTISGAVQVLTSITVAPGSASISNGGTQPFTATAFDQNNSPMSPQPTFTWSVNAGGTISSSGLFSATTIGGPYTVTASAGSVSGTAQVTVTDPSLDTPPTVATPAAANPNPVTSSTTALSVLGADDGGEAALTYTWVATTIPSGTVSPTFSANGTNAAKNTTATFKKAGSYTFTVTIKEPSNQTVTSSVNVTVNQTLSFITVTPSPVTVMHGATQQFTATAKDLFGNAMTVQPAMTWTATGGTVTSGGLYTAGSTTGSAFAVTAAAGGKSGKAMVTIN